jgi:hypothetical protein
MRILRLLFGAAAICCAGTSSMAAEGSSVAGPIGGTDVRSAQLPPPGLYGGLVLLYAKANQFFDGSGKLVPALSGLDLARTRAGPFLLYVPNVEVFGGSIGIGGIVPAGSECGRLFETTPKRCISGLGDPYVEIAWSRFFGTMRPSQHAGAFPIAEGLTLALGFGTVIPIGRYNAEDAATQGLVIGNGVWDFAPSVAFTYMTRPLLAEGTEISAKLYWNNYLTNPATQYSTGTLLNLDFAISERVGRFQGGLAGVYIAQVADDKLAGVTIPPDGRRVEALSLGGVVVYDMPEHGTSVKLKWLAPVVYNNFVNSYGVSIGWIKKL